MHKKSPKCDPVLFTFFWWLCFLLFWIKFCIIYWSEWNKTEGNSLPLALRWATSILKVYKKKNMYKLNRSHFWASCCNKNYFTQRGIQWVGPCWLCLKWQRSWVSWTQFLDVYSTAMALESKTTPRVYSSLVWCIAYSLCFLESLCGNY